MPIGLRSHIIRTLATKDPSNTRWQRDFSISLERLGDVLKAQGEYPDALRNYQDSLSIRQQLVKQGLY